MRLWNELLSISQRLEITKHTYAPERELFFSYSTSSHFVTYIVNLVNNIFNYLLDFITFV